MKKTVVLSLLLIGIVAIGADKLTAISLPNTEQVVVLQGNENYVKVGYYAWGENWSYVNSKKSSQESESSMSFSITDNIPSTKGTYTVTGDWKQLNNNTLSLNASLSTQKYQKLMMSQFTLSLGKMFANQKAIIISEGKTIEKKLPFPKPTTKLLADSITFIDKDNKKTVVKFAKPTHVSLDGGARLIIAQDSITKGSKYDFSFTLTLPEELKFYPAGNKLPVDMSNWYTFTGKNTTSEQSELNMTSWLEKPAGKHGRITRNGANLSYNNNPIKLWGVNVTYINCAPEKEVAEKKADFYASLGINSVRLHKYADGCSWAGILSTESATKYDPASLDRMDYFVAALKKRGIYTKLSPVFIIDIGPEDSARIPYMSEFGTEFKNSRISPKHGSYFFSSELQELLIEQAVNLLKHKNPYTNTTYAEEPAIAYLEIYNEDSIYWYGTNIALQKYPTLRKRAANMFFDWLKNKYKTEDKLLNAWGKKALNSSMVKVNKFPLDESWENKQIYPVGSPFLFDPNTLTGNQRTNRVRLLDTMLFLFETQNEVYSKYIKAVRDAGFKGEIVTSNWQAGRMMSHFFNLKSDQLGGVIDRHNYFGGGLKANVGLFNSTSMVSNPGSGNISASLQQVDNYPFMLSEWNHVFPTEWGVEGIAIIGTYGMGFQGWDASYAFEMTRYDTGNFSTALGLTRWDIATPNILGIFPAVSRQVLRGDVKEAQTVHYRNVDLESLKAGKVSFDEKVVQSKDIKSFNSTEFPHQALAAVKGLVRYNDSFTETEKFNIKEHMENGAIVSDTKELRWVAGKDIHDGYFQIDTPATQAVVGFSKDKKIELTDVTIEPKSFFSAIYFTAKSIDKDIASDNKVLISVLGRARNEGAKILTDTVVISLGNRNAKNALTGPVLMEGISAKITLKKGSNAKIYLLDQEGVKTSKLLPNNKGEFVIDTARDKTPFYLIEK